MNVLKFVNTGLVAGVAALVGCAAIAQQINHPDYTDEGGINAPEQWRDWIFVGAPLTPHGLNGDEAPFPEFHYVYIEPSAYAHYTETGEWPDGTQIAKELLLVRGTADCDNGICKEPSGAGYFPGEFQGLEMSVKDTQKFPEEPGGWAYFSFGHQPQPYQETAMAAPTDSCNACHDANAAGDFVFTQFYALLREVNDSQ